MVFPWWLGRGGIITTHLIRESTALWDEAIRLFFGQRGVSWKNPEASTWKRLGKNWISDLGFNYPAIFPWFIFEAWTGIQIEENSHSLLIEELKLQAGISLTSEFSPVLCFVVSACFTNHIRSKETQTPPCQWQRSCFLPWHDSCPQPKSEIKFA